MLKPADGPALDAPAARTAAGIGLMLVFAVVAPLLDMFAKLATAEASPAVVSLARFLLQTALLAPILAARGTLRPPDRSEWGLHAARGALLAGSTLCFVAAVSVMPLADALALVFVSPLIVTLLAGPMLGETVGWRRYAACAVGFAGALLVARPGVSAFGWVALAPLGTALFFALYLTLTRRHALKRDPVTMQLWSGIAGAAAMAVALPLGAVAGLEGFAIAPFGWWTAAMLLGMGVCATVAHLAVAAAFQRAPAAVLAPFQYGEIVVATAAGWLVFGDFPGPLTWIGVAVIVAAGLVVFHRERAAARRAMALNATLRPR